MLGPNSEIRRVLFVCNGNTCRSPMAEAIARQLLGATAYIESAGVEAAQGAEATKDAVLVMKERGRDISAHRSRPLDKVNVQAFHLVIALTPMIAETLDHLGVDASKVRVLNIPDPYCKGTDCYRATVLAIERDLQHLFESSSKERSVK